MADYQARINRLHAYIKSDPKFVVEQIEEIENQLRILISHAPDGWKDILRKTLLTSLEKIFWSLPPEVHEDIMDIKRRAGILG